MVDKPNRFELIEKRITDILDEQHVTVEEFIVVTELLKHRALHRTMQPSAQPGQPAVNVGRMYG